MSLNEYRWLRDENRAQFDALTFQDKAQCIIRPVTTQAEAAQWSELARRQVQLLVNDQLELAPDEIITDIDSIQRSIKSIQNNYNSTKSGSTRWPGREYDRLRGSAREDLDRRYHATNVECFKALPGLTPLHSAACKVETYADPLLRPLLVDALLNPACTMPVSKKVSRLIDLSAAESSSRDYEIFRLVIDSDHKLGDQRHYSEYVKHEGSSFCELAERLNTAVGLSEKDKSDYVDRMVSGIETTQFPDTTRIYAMDLLMPFASDPTTRMNLVQMSAGSLTKMSKSGDVFDRDYAVETLSAFIADPTLQPHERAVLRDTKFQLENPRLFTLLEKVGIQIDWQGEKPRLEIFQYPIGHNPVARLQMS